MRLSRRNVGSDLHGIGAPWSIHSCTPYFALFTHRPSMSLPHEADPRIPAPNADEDPAELKLMISGQPYKSGDPYVGRIRDAHGIKVQQINRIDAMETRMDALRELIHMGKEVWIVQGLFFEYVSAQHFARV
jgi:hypothetical protein